MILVVDGVRGASLRSPDDFGRFHVEILESRCGLEKLRSVWSGWLRFESDSDVWVTADLFSEVLSVGKDPVWKESFRNMIETARRFGWIRNAEQRLEIKAHVVWAKEDGDSRAG